MRIQDQEVGWRPSWSALRTSWAGSSEWRSGGSSSAHGAAGSARSCTSAWDVCVPARSSSPGPSAAPTACWPKPRTCETAGDWDSRSPSWSTSRSVLSSASWRCRSKWLQKYYLLLGAHQCEFFDVALPQVVLLRFLQLHHLFVHPPQRPAPLS